MPPSRPTEHRPATRWVEAFTTPSGLGGVFTVSVVEPLDDGRVRVRIHNPHYPDWDGKLLTRAHEQLRPLGEKIQIREGQQVAEKGQLFSALAAHP